RPIGSEALAADFENLIQQYRYPEQMDSKALLEIRRIKARVESERLPQGADSTRHLKLGRGSISDVEWLVQVLQMRFAHSYPSLRVLGTVQALQGCVSEKLLEQSDAEILEKAWRIASRARSGLILANDKSNDTIPSDRKQLEALARILEYEPGRASLLEEDYLAATRRARAVFEKLFVK
ncbi:MAG: hypothetical protein RIQ37_952, partial [Actinomycetota bacterium]